MNNNYPPGLLSFLYNVMNDSTLNAQFQSDPANVMKAFALSDEAQTAIEEYNDNSEDALLKLIQEELIAERDKFW
jgi:hypothetical protein